MVPVSVMSVPVPGDDVIQAFRRVAVGRLAREGVDWALAGADPDAYASALMAKDVGKRFGIPDDRTRILLAGQPSGHAQSKKMWRQLGFSENEFLRFSLHASPDRSYGILDSNQGIAEDDRYAMDLPHGAARLFGDPAIVVDHHGTPGPSRPGQFRWVEQHAGACASMLAQLGKRMRIEFDARTSTAGAIGIRTDTDDLDPRVTTTFDREAYDHLMGRADRELVEYVVRFDRTAREKELIRSAIRTTQLHRSILLARLDMPVAPGEEYVFSMISQQLMRESRNLSVSGNDMGVVIAWGCKIDPEGKRDPCLHFSARRIDVGIELDPLLKALFGDQYAGARKRAGGAHISLPEVPARVRTNSTWNRMIFPSILRHQEGLIERIYSLGHDLLPY